MQTKEDKKRSGENRLNVRINPAWRQAFGLAAKARWTDATGLIHQFVKAIVDIERKQHPLIFNRFGDLDSIPLQDIKGEQAIPAEVPEDIRRAALMAEITTTAQSLLRQSTSGRVTIEQAGEAIIRSLEAVAAKLLNEPGDLEPEPTIPKIIQSTRKQKDKINKVIEVTFAFTGKHPSDADIQKVREMLEREQDGNLNESS